MAERGVSRAQPGTIEAAHGLTVPAATDQIGYADLYARWERGNWSTTDIDFTQDRIDWHERFTDDQRRRAAP